MRRLLSALVMAGLAFAAPGPAQAQGQAQAPQKIGIVLMHGKLGIRMGGWLVAALQNAGYPVVAPEMCWSGQRRYDRPYPDCLAEIDAAIASLKSQGATSIVVGGISLGGNAALAYGATHTGLKGIIGLSPADDPTRKANSSNAKLSGAFANSLAKARDLIAQGKGDEKASFDDINTGPSGSYAVTIDTTPRIFLSFYGPDSLANIPPNVAKLKAPLLWVAGSDDPTQSGGPAFAFDKAPPNPLNRYVVVHANHRQVPDAAADTALAWLAALR